MRHADTIGTYRPLWLFLRRKHKGRWGARYLNLRLQSFTAPDPRLADYPDWSPYVYSMADPVNKLDAGGKDVVDVQAGINDAIKSNFTLSLSRQDYQDYQGGNKLDYLAGQTAGDAVSTAVGYLGAKGGAGLTLLTVSGGASAVAALLTAAGAVYMSGVGAMGAKNLLIESGPSLLREATRGAGDGGNTKKTSKIDRAEFKKEREAYWKNEAKKNPDKYSAEDLAKMKKGRAPTGPDGNPVELHHKDQTPEGGVDPMSRTDHRIGENYRKNHPNENK